MAVLSKGPSTSAPHSEGMPSKSSSRGPDWAAAPAGVPFGIGLGQGCEAGSFLPEASCSPFGQYDVLGFGFSDLGGASVHKFIGTIYCKLDAKTLGGLGPLFAKG